MSLPKRLSYCSGRPELRTFIYIDAKLCLNLYYNRYIYIRCNICMAMICISLKHMHVHILILYFYCILVYFSPAVYRNGASYVTQALLWLLLIFCHQQRRRFLTSSEATLKKPGRPVVFKGKLAIKREYLNCGSREESSGIKHRIIINLHVYSAQDAFRLLVRST